MSNNSEHNSNENQQKKKLSYGNDKPVAATVTIEKMGDTFYMKTMALLAEHFGYYNLRALIRSIITTLVVKKRDVCAILAPGFGRSICYQLPAVLNDGLVVVITPITFTINEQVQRLNMSGVSACILDQFHDRMSKVNEILNKSKCKILYISPQIISSRVSVTLQALKHVNVQLIAVLEAHCTSPFSHDYRLLYRELSILKDTFPTVPMLAVTSAPSKVVREDIITSLKLNQPLVSYSGFLRGNLYLQVNEKRSDDLTKDILSVISESDGPTLIYAMSRSHVTSLITKLKAAGITSVKGYYVGLPEDYINKTYQSFAANEFKILVTTPGGGLIVAKPDIRNVIHFNVSKDLESYYQEIGRAGRDGLSAKCVLFYSQADMDTHEMLRNASKLPGPEEVTATRNTIANALKDYALTKDCRWNFFLKHFNEVGGLTKRLCYNCDNCKIRTSDAHAQSTSKGPGRRLNKTFARAKSNKLLTKLKAERLRLSTELNCVPYLIASDKALMMLSLKRPCTPLGIKRCGVEGFSSTMIQRFGNTFVKIIIEHLNEKQKAETVFEKIKKMPLKAKYKKLGIKKKRSARKVSKQTVPKATTCENDGV